MILAFVLALSACKTDLFPYHVEKLKLPQNSQSIMVIGDWGRRGNENQLANAYVMNRLACYHPVHSVLTVGDNFYNNGVLSIDEPHWTESFERVFDGFCLKPIQWWPAIGNHDIRGSALAQYEYSTCSHRWNFPSAYYDRWVMTEDSVRIHFVTVDTNPFNTSYHTSPSNDLMAQHLANSDTTAQLAWLDSVLASGEPDWLVVYGHHAVYGAEGRHGSTPELIHSFAPRFESNGVDIYFNGHNHSLEVSEVEGVTYAASGSFSGGQSRIELQPFSLFGSIEPGFLVSSFSKDTLQLNFMNSEGQMIFVHTKVK